MERLTRIVDGAAEVKKCKGIGCGEVCSNTVNCGSCPIQEAHAKLAAYENTGLEPEQIVEMDRLYREKCEELEKQKSRLLATENRHLKRINASLEIQIKKLKEQLEAKENS